MSLSTPETIGDELRAAATDAGDTVGWICGSERVTFAEMDAVADRVASGLLALGLRRGDRLALNGLTDLDWLRAYFGATRIGVAVVGLNVRYRSTELRWMLDRSRVSAVATVGRVGEDDLRSLVDGVVDELGTVDHVISLGDGPSPTLTELAATEVDRAAVDEAAATVVADDIAMIIYTSGTTGQPKGATLTHTSQLAAARGQADHTRVTGDDVMVSALPLNHVGGITCSVMTLLMGRAMLVLVPTFDPGVVVSQMAAHGATIAVGVPTMHTLMLGQEGMAEVDTGRVRLVITGGSNAEPALLRQLFDTFPDATVMNMYGMSETSGAVVMSGWDDDTNTIVNSIGVPIGDADPQVFDIEEDRELPAGEIGELTVAGHAVVPGYDGMPDETAAAFDADGRIRTGDLAELTPDGHVILRGRRKEMYLQGGYNVYPVEVENVLADHPGVGMVAIIGVPDPVLGEVGRCFLVPADGADLDPDELAAWCRDRLADYKVPRQFVIRDELPLTPVGKIQKSALLSPDTG